MAVNWLVATFDWTKFQQLEPILVECSRTGDFTSLALPEAESLLEKWPEDEPASSLCNAIIQVLCCSEETAEFPAGFLELIHWLRQKPKASEPAETLAHLITSHPHIEEWFTVEFGVAGLLDVWQTRELSDQLKQFEANYVPAPAPRGIMGFAKRFSTIDTHAYQVQDLLSIVYRAANEGLGVAVIRQ